MKHTMQQWKNPQSAMCFIYFSTLNASREDSKGHSPNALCFVQLSGVDWCCSMKLGWAARKESYSNLSVVSAHSSERICPSHVVDASAGPCLGGGPGGSRAAHAARVHQTRPVPCEQAKIHLHPPPLGPCGFIVCCCQQLASARPSSP